MRDQTLALDAGFDAGPAANAAAYERDFAGRYPAAICGRLRMAP